MKKLNLVLAGIGSAALMSYGVVAHAKPGDSTSSVAIVPLSWTAGTATIDGSISDWNLATDAATKMCTAGSIDSSGNCSGSGKVQLSTLYTRYDCNTNTMYVLVLETGSYEAEQSAGDAWVTVGGNSSKVVNGSSGSNGTPPDFAWVTVGGDFQGYEASFTLAAGTYNDVQVHLNVSGNTSSTGKITSTRSIVVPADCTMPVVVVDTDKDTIPDSTDNCPAVANMNQADVDGDKIGDACEADTDKDGVVDDSDNCPAIANANQADADGDKMGDACEADTDKDGVIDDSDNCPAIANANQADADGDKMGDACDTVAPPPVVLDCSDEGYAAANPAECTVTPPPVLDCTDEGYATANPEECTVTPPPVLDCDDAGYAAENPEECTVTYGDSKASVIGIWKYVGSMSAQDFDATYKEGTDYVFTGDDSGDYLLQGIDDEGKTTSMSGAKMK